MKTKAVFLDRDGTLIEDAHYLSKPEQIKWCPGVFEDLRRLLALDFILIIITNQSGIGRGYFTEDNYQNVTRALEDQAQKEAIYFSKIYYCPHGPEKDENCSCRKPRTALFEKAREEFDIDMSQSLAVGDRDRDIQPASDLGVPHCFKIEANQGLKLMMDFLAK